MRTFEEDIEIGREYHGHLCAGMVLGVRMARYLCTEMGMDDPRGDRDLTVFVEMARCPTDAVYVVTGITVGRRRVKLVDLGKFAMTFVDPRTGRALRAAARTEIPSAPRGTDPVAFFAGYTDAELFDVRAVHVEIAPEDMPGHPKRRVPCESCGEEVLDARDVARDGRLLCRHCAGEIVYYVPAESLQEVHEPA